MVCRNLKDRSDIPATQSVIERPFAFAYIRHFRILMMITRMVTLIS